VILSSANNVRKSAMKLVLSINLNMIVVMIMNENGHKNSNVYVDNSALFVNI
jgi:hypothetical protein